MAETCRLFRGPAYGRNRGDLVVGPSLGAGPGWPTQRSHVAGDRGGQ